MSDQPPPPYGDQPHGGATPEPPVPPYGDATLPYGTPAPPPPPPPPPTGPTSGDAPYAPYGQEQPYTTPLQPAYGYGYGASHSGATTSMVLGIISIVVPVLGICLCFLIGAVSVILGPIGIWQAVKARREIDAAPAQYVNRGHAVAGLACSIIGTVLGTLALIGGVLIIALYGSLFFWGASSSTY